MTGPNKPLNRKQTMTGKLFKTCAAVFSMAITVFWLINDVDAGVTYETSALSGDTAPGTASGVFFSSFSVPRMNEAGQVAFKATLSGEDVSEQSNSGIWSENMGSLRLVAREGDAAPGAVDGAVYSDFGNSELVFNTSGQTAFSGTLAGLGVDSTNNRGIWSEGLGSLALVARIGDIAPGTGGRRYTRFFSILGSLHLNDAGQTAFSAETTGLVDGIWSESSGPLALVAVERGNFSQLFYTKFNGMGQTIFITSISGKHSIVLEEPGTLSIIVNSGDPAPGTATATFGGLFEPSLNDAGQIAFRANLVGTGVDSTNDRGIWSEGSGTLNLIAREGSPAPGTDIGVLFGSGFDDPLINGAGDTVFTGNLTGEGLTQFLNDTGMWLEKDGALDLIAQSGVTEPPGVSSSDFADFREFSTYVLNGVGQVAFVHSIGGGGVDTTNNRGIWATDPSGELVLIVRTGDLFDVNNDPSIEDLRTIKSVDLLTGSGGEDGQPTSFNDAGQLAFKLSFTDGSEGIFVATIPEPGTLGVLGVFAGLVAGRRGKRVA